MKHLLDHERTERYTDVREVTIDMPEDLKSRYCVLADQSGCDTEFLMNQALSKSIDRLEYEYGLMQKVDDWRKGNLQTVTVDELEEDLGLN